MFCDFIGGLHLKKQKNIMDLAIEVMSIPERVYIPFSQHKGKPAIPMVKTGDLVKIGTKIGEADKDISACIHSSVSGKVIDIKSHPHPLLGEALCCIIESDYSENWENKFLDANYQSLDRQELLKGIKQAGIVGLGGGAFPTDIKLLSGVQKKLDLLIINGCESEPNLSVDYRIMLEYPVCVIEGAKIIQKILDAPKMVFAISKSYHRVAALLKKEGVKVMLLPDRFPQGSERLLIKKIARKNVSANKLPMDIGYMVQNVSTCYAVFQAIKYNKPLIERVVTVSGDGIKEPKNILVKIGTPVADIIQFCGGLKGNIKKIIFGGLMTGIAQFSLSTPVIKAFNGIVFQGATNGEEIKDCVRCASCIDTCPMNLLPQIIFQSIKQNKYNDAIDYGLNECIECGCCAYVCPSNIPFIHYFKFAKMKIANG